MKKLCILVSQGIIRDNLILALSGTVFLNQVLQAQSKGFAKFELVFKNIACKGTAYRKRLNSGSSHFDVKFWYHPEHLIVSFWYHLVSSQFKRVSFHIFQSLATQILSKLKFIFLCFLPFIPLTKTLSLFFLLFYPAEYST